MPKFEICEEWCPANDCASDMVHLLCRCGAQSRHNAFSKLSTPRGTFNCPICQKSTPHAHSKSKWIGVDFDGTLAHDVKHRTDPYELGEPVEHMVNRVKDWVAKGFEVRVFTARMCEYSHTLQKERDLPRMESMIRAWCKKHIGLELAVTNQKDGLMEVLWDDRAVGVVNGTGVPVVAAAAIV